MALSRQVVGQSRQLLRESNAEGAAGQLGESAVLCKGLLHLLHASSSGVCPRCLDRPIRSVHELAEIQPGRNRNAMITRRVRCCGSVHGQYTTAWLDLCEEQPRFSHVFRNRSKPRGVKVLEVPSTRCRASTRGPSVQMSRRAHFGFFRWSFPAVTLRCVTGRIQRGVSRVLQVVLCNLRPVTASHTGS